MMPFHEERTRFRLYSALCALAVCVATALVVPFDYGRYGETFVHKGPLGYFELPSVIVFLSVFLVSAAVLLPLAYRRVAGPKFRRVVWLLAAAFCVCCLSAWFAVTLMLRVGEDAFAMAAVILVLVSLPCALFILVGVPASVLYAIRRLG